MVYGVIDFVTTCQSNAKINHLTRILSVWNNYAHMTMVTTIRLPHNLHDWTKKRARSNGQTISGFMRVLLEKQKHDEEQAKRIEKIKQVEA